MWYVAKHWCNLEYQLLGTTAYWKLQQSHRRDSPVGLAQKKDTQTHTHTHKVNTELLTAHRAFYGPYIRNIPASGKGNPQDQACFWTKKPLEALDITRRRPETRVSPSRNSEPLGLTKFRSMLGGLSDISLHILGLQEISYGPLVRGLSLVVVGI